MPLFLKFNLASVFVLLGLALPAGAQTNITLIAPDGAWTWFNDPRALFHNGILFFGCVRHADGKTMLGAFDPAMHATTELWTSSRSQKDDHNVPGLLLKEDGSMLAIYARHGTDPFFVYRLCPAADPAVPGNWGPEQKLDDTGSGLTYANPFQLAAESGRIYDFSRDLNFNPTVFTSIDGGKTWSAPQLLIQTGRGRIRPYVKYASDYRRRIDFLYTDGHPRDVTNSLYHCYYQGGTFYRTDGSRLKDFSDLPLLHDSGERGSVIYTYSDAPARSADDHIPTGRAWCWEITYQTNGWPVCVFSVQRDFVTGTNWFDDRIYYYYARWTGTQWQKHFIGNAGRPLYRAEDDYAGGICLDPANPNHVYLSSNAAEPFRLSHPEHVRLSSNQRYELWHGITANGGRSFKWSPVTTNSAKDNLRPYIPRGQSGTPALVWFRGTYSAYQSYDCEIVGVFPKK